jgi:hypothetical protein
MSGTIQVPGCSSRGAVAQAWITSGNAVSKRISWPGALMKRSKVFRSERCSLKSCVRSTMRGFGLHHRIGWPTPNHGKMPRA